MSSILLIAGLGRCGSTMVMEMLAAGGHPVVGSKPDFEEEAALPTLRSRGPQVYVGSAVKVLEMHRGCLSSLPGGARYRAVWLDRTPREQARSMSRFLAAAGAAPENRAVIRRLERGLDRDRPVALTNLRNAVGDQLLMLRFEEILVDPLSIARRLAAWSDIDLDPVQMAAAVHVRSPKCRDVPIEAGQVSRPFYPR